MLDNRGFDLWAEGYDMAACMSDEANTYPFAGYKAVLGYIYRIIMDRRGAVVLDIGFGTAALTTKLYEGGCAIYGQDFSERMIELAREKMPDARLYQGDFSQGLVQALRARNYDFIVATYALHHLTDGQKYNLLHGLLERLNKGGALLIGDVAFETRADLERCRREAGEAWDDEECYFVIDEIRQAFPNLSYQSVSFCAGVLALS